jgi:hypothetical protein
MMYGTNPSSHLTGNNKTNIPDHGRLRTILAMPSVIHTTASDVRCGADWVILSGSESAGARRWVQFR